MLIQSDIKFNFKNKQLEVQDFEFVLETQAVRKLQELMKIIREQEVDLSHFKHLSHTTRPNVSTVPLVHPKMFEIKQFFHICNDPTTLQQRGQEVQFDDLLSQENPNRFVCLVGPPGVGKTTLSKRLANNQVYELSLSLNFASINCNEKLTLQELLLNNQFVNLGFSDKNCQQVFSWINENQSKCLLVMDGLDQAQFKIDEKPTNDARLKVSTIIAFLFEKTFLPNVRIIVTSRLHAVLDLHSSQRPDAVYQLEGLSDENTDNLLQFFSGDRYDDISTNLRKLAPEVKILCTCPLLLQMYVLSQLDPSETIGEAKTITRIFATVLENLQSLKNLSTKFNKIQARLARLAFNTFMNNQVLMTWKQVTDGGLVQEEIQDLIVTVPGRKGMEVRMLDENKLLYFSPQLIHEYYCACHIWEGMSFKDFCQFFEKTQSNNQFIITKKFLYGLAFDIDCNKGEMFLNSSLNKLEKSCIALINEVTNLMLPIREVLIV